jgi:hypothetical protein
MYVTYFDEVKNDVNQRRDFYFVGGIVVPFDQVGAIERRVTAYAQELFGNCDLTQETEFHGDFIYRGKGPFRGRSMADRAAIIKRLADFIVEGQIIKKVYSAICVPKLYKQENAAEFAFAHFVERLQMCVGKSPCLMIGDLDDEQVRNMVRDFSQYRARGTPWAHGLIESLVDSIHFCRSHHSRMIQLADVFLWMTVHKWGFRKSAMATLVTEAIKDHNLFPTNYKVWPQPQ